MLKFVTAIFFTLALTAIARSEPVSFNRDVRPILSNNCFRCHGPDEADRKAKMRLDVPGETDLKELIARISSTDPDDIMPPPESNKTLTETQIGILKKWVAEGAKYEQHWAFIPPQTPEIPASKNALDHLNPPTSAPAEPLALVRRTYLDLIGLPPTPAEADAFADDPSPEAYAKLVDQLLESPLYGERWARRWLDLARYADTNGYEKDRDRSIWPYRDWVIRALNSDMPFDQFTIEQLAGDMLPNATQDQRIATGFHRNTMLNEEGGIDPLEFRFHAITDRVATTGTTWLGLTTGCAQCHTHKFDPITHTDYFGMMAYMNNADEPDLILRDVATKRKNQERLAKADQLLSALPDRWPIPGNEPTFKTVSPKEVTVTGESKAKIDSTDDSILITGSNPSKTSYTITIETTEKNLSALRLETLVTADKTGPGRTKHGNFVLTEIEISATPIGEEKSQPIAIASATAEAEQPNFPVEKAFDGDQSTGWAIHENGKPLNENRAAIFKFAKPINHKSGTRLTIKLAQKYGGQHTIGRFRIALGTTNTTKKTEQSPRQLAEAAFKQWLAKERAETAAWQPIIPTKATANFPFLTHEGGGVIFAGGDISKHDIYTLELAPQPRATAAIRLEALPDDRLPDRGPGMTYYEGRKGDFYLTEFKIGGSTITSASESYSKNRFGNSAATAKLATDGDIQTGWSVAGKTGQRHVATFVLAKPIPANQPINVEMHFGRHYASSLGKFRLSASPEQPKNSGHELEIAQLLPKEELAKAERASLLDYFLLQAPELATHSQQIHDLRKAPAGTTTLVMSERPAAHPRPTHLHHRGEFLSPKQAVQPRLPDAIFPAGNEYPKDRLEFARWLVSGNNPLTARVVVNRHWATLFGTGIVKSLDDFGMQGALPSNQPLLDYLANSLVEKDWSLKKLHRQIVLSQAYQQESNSRTRLEAEVIRDSSLSVAGLLSEKMFGSPVRPPQPSGVTEVAFGSPKWNPSQGADRFRRSLYIYQKRTAPFAMLTTFDGGSGEACIARRDRSNTPLQALTLMNDPMFIEIAEAFGKTIASSDGDNRQKIHHAFRRTLTRPPNESELSQLVEFHTEHQNWTALARVLLSLDETITKP